MTLTAVFIAALLVAAAAVILIHARRRRKLGGLPEGKLLYTYITDGDCPVLVSSRYGIKGRPDALVRAPSGAVIPVERKKAAAPRRPYDGDVIQASAYCILVEETYGQAPPFMRIQYADRWFDEPYTPERKEWVLRTCERLRHARRQSDCNRSHRMKAKCRNCGQRPHCGQAL
jgi:CRISPR-associated exonuclease Cas4